MALIRDFNGGRRAWRKYASRLDGIAQLGKQRDCPDTSFDVLFQLFAGGLTKRTRGAA
jgi:hypothetical protein